VTDDFTYAEVGATRDAALPPGYRHLRYRTVVGTGRTALATAVAAVLEWRMHEAAGLHITAPERTAARDATASARRTAADAPPAVAGLTVVGEIGAGRVRLRVPCRVVWADETGFAYGTLPGHPARGEEAFRLSMDGGEDSDEQVWLEVCSFSRPARWFTRLTGPAFPLVQHVFAYRCGSVLRRLVRQR
jgi:uncharacterized protein (UPF0548 family)